MSAAEREWCAESQDTDGDPVVMGAHLPCESGGLMEEVAVELGFER